MTIDANYMPVVRPHADDGVRTVDAMYHTERLCMAVADHIEKVTLTMNPSPPMRAALSQAVAALRADLGVEEGVPLADNMAVVEDGQSFPVEGPDGTLNGISAIKVRVTGNHQVSTRMRDGTGAFVTGDTVTVTDSLQNAAGVMLAQPNGAIKAVTLDASSARIATRSTQAALTYQLAGHPGYTQYAQARIVGLPVGSINMDFTKPEYAVVRDTYALANRKAESAIDVLDVNGARIATGYPRVAANVLNSVELGDVLNTYDPTKVYQLYTRNGYRSPYLLQPDASGPLTKLTLTETGVGFVSATSTYPVYNATTGAVLDNIKCTVDHMGNPRFTRFGT